MKLSIADKLALIYTSAGSMRKTAAIAGLSHQQVSRILHKASAGESIAHYEAKAEIRAGVDVAYDIHKDLSRGVARRHGLPFDGSIPVFAERLPLTMQAVYVDGQQVFKGTAEECRTVANGRRLFKVDQETGEVLRDFQLTPQQARKAQWTLLLGERAGSLKLHWLSDKLRDKWLQSAVKSGAYYSASVGSVVNLPKYMKTAAQRITAFMNRGGIKTADMIKARESLRLLVKDHVELQRVFTPYTSMDPNFPPELVTESINDKLQTRHAPAVGEKGTAYADQVLLQLDTRKQRNAKPQKTRRTGSGNRGSVRKK